MKSTLLKLSTAVAVTLGTNQISHAGNNIINSAKQDTDNVLLIETKNMVGKSISVTHPGEKEITETIQDSMFDHCLIRSSLSQAEVVDSYEGHSEKIQINFDGKKYILDQSQQAKVKEIFNTCIETAY